MPRGLDADETYVAASLYAPLMTTACLDLTPPGPDRCGRAFRAKRALYGGFIEGDGAIRSAYGELHRND